MRTTSILFVLTPTLLFGAASANILYKESISDDKAFLDEDPV